MSVRIQTTSLDSSSNQTILPPQDSYASSSSLFDFADLIARNEAKSDYHKRRFFFSSLVFCLGLHNLWRFPREILLHGKATFIYIYTIYSVVIGTSLLYFEVALGQYANRGFAKIFVLCPLFKGIPMSMSFYCLIVNLFYNTLNVYSCVYIFSSLNAKMPQEFCRNESKSCTVNSTHQWNSTEFAFFRDDVLGGIESETRGDFNLRNSCILLIIWFTICAAIITNIGKILWIHVTMSALIITTLIYTAIVSSTLPGASDGIKHFFLPKSTDLSNFETWVISFEQSVVGFGLGSGRFIVFGSHVGHKTPMDAMCAWISAITLTCTLISGIVAANAAGAVAYARKTTIPGYFLRRGCSQSEIEPHVILTQLFNLAGFGVGQFTTALFFTVLFFVGCYSGAMYTNVAIQFLKNYVPWKGKYRRVLLPVFVCFLSFVLGLAMITPVGRHFMKAIDRVFVGPSLLILILSELVAVIYLFGKETFYDDIDFTLGTSPHWYFQLMWFGWPIFIFPCLLASLYVRFAIMSLNSYDITLIWGMGLFVILPLLVHAIHSLYVAFKSKNLESVLRPLERLSEEIGSTTRTRTPNSSSNSRNK